jgi:pyruvate carboxylase
VEFLLETAGPRAGEVVFIEMNPRIQVEHTVTEEVTDVDLVQSQMRIAAGRRSPTSDCVRIRSACAGRRCSVASRPRTRRRASARTREDHHLPFAGRRRHPPRRGDDGRGSQVSPHFDSLLAKLTCRGRDFGAAVVRSRRALAEFRIRGVSTNIPFLQAVLDDPAFVAGDVSTSFIDERPELLRGRVEGPRIEDRGVAGRDDRQPSARRIPAVTDPRAKLPSVDLSSLLLPVRDSAPQPGPGRVRGAAARSDAARRHRDDVPRRAVAAGHARAHGTW